MSLLQYGIYYFQSLRHTLLRNWLNFAEICKIKCVKRTYACQQHLLHGEQEHWENLGDTRKVCLEDGNNENILANYLQVLKNVIAQLWLASAVQVLTDKGSLGKNRTQSAYKLIGAENRTAEKYILEEQVTALFCKGAICGIQEQTTNYRKQTNKKKKQNNKEVNNTRNISNNCDIWKSHPASFSPSYTVMQWFLNSGHIVNALLGRKKGIKWTKLEQNQQFVVRKSACFWKP